MKRKSDAAIGFAALILLAALIFWAAEARGAWLENFGRTGTERLEERLPQLAYPIGYLHTPREETAAGQAPESGERTSSEAEEACHSGRDAATEGLQYLGTYWVTGYDTCAQCCGKTDGITASGTQATVGATCAATLPFGTVLYIDGIGVRVVEDRGVGDGCIDVVCADHAACYAITGWYEVWVVVEDSE